MRRFVYAILCVASALAAPGCADVGDSSVASGEGPGGSGDGSAEDGSLATGTDGASSTAVDAGVDSTLPPGDDAGANDAGVFDATTNEDAGSQDAGTSDSAVEDSSAADSGAPDGVADAGGAVDSGGPDEGTADAGSDSAAHSDASNGVDAGDAGGGGDSGADAGGVLAACTTPGQTNCVSCQGSTGGTCTPTEALIVQYDIAKGLATAPGDSPDTSCYYCLYNASALDDVTYSDTGHECGDTTNATECLATVSCILNTGCASVAVNHCYCGTAGVSTTCNNVGATNAANGACASAIASGLGFAENDGHDILLNLEATTLPSGVADKVFQSAISNTCTMCQQ